MLEGSINPFLTELGPGGVPKVKAPCSTVAAWVQEGMGSYSGRISISSIAIVGMSQERTH